MHAKPLVEVRNLGKSFGPTRALDGVSFAFYPGEIFAMVGANGAGKSTLIKIICGYYRDYEGDILIEGKPARFSAPRDAYEHGVQTVHQIINQGVVQNMTVAENLALADMLSREGGFFYRAGRIMERAREIAAKMNLDYLDLDAQVASLPQSDRQMIAIARALAARPKLLILDEPTSSLSEKEAERLFKTLFQLRDMGVAILYVSHRLHEIERIADKVGVIRDGVQGALLERPFNVKQIVTAMVGELEADRREAVVCDESVCQPRIELRGLAAAPESPPIDLKVYPGEILGITGLIGSGKSELARALFGIAPPAAGEILLNGEPVTINSIAQAIALGVFMVPEDRNNNAVIPEFTIRQNITLPFLRSFSPRLGVLKHGRERAEANRMIQAMGIKCASESSYIEELSGGNQQKVIVARWLLKQCNVLILDEPYQGVDIRSRHDINRYLAANKEGKAIIIMAADLDEVLEVADRIVVFNHGRIAGLQQASEADRTLLLHWTSQSPETIQAERRL